MSLESVFAARNNRPQQSRQLQRRVCLLQVVLPHFAEASMHACVSAKRGPRKEFWTRVLNPCLPFSLGQCRFDRIGDEHAGLVRLVLENLERVIDLDDSAVAVEFKSSQFPRLEILRNLATELTPESEDVLLITVVKPDTDSDCNEIIDSLKKLVSVVTDDTEIPPPEDTRMVWKPKPLMAPFLGNLFSTMSNHWTCKCKPSHKAALLLCTNRTLPKNNASPSFTVLLSRRMVPRPTKWWQETGVTVREQLPKPRVHIQAPNSEDTERRVPVTDLCTIIQRSMAHLSFNVDGVALSLLQDSTNTDKKKHDFDDCELVSFTKGFLENDSELQLQGKICLAVILTYNFLDFCGDKWFPEGWTKDSLYLMQRSKTLFLQPFLVTKMPAGKSDLQSKIKSTVSLTHKLLCHGILLMEVFQQEAISKRDCKTTDLKSIAQEKFKSIDWDVSERFARVVESCIRGELIDNIMISSQHDSAPIMNLSGGGSISPEAIADQDFVRVFCEKILSPLEADFKSQWQDKDPDQSISTLFLSSIKQPGDTELTPKSGFSSKLLPKNTFLRKSRTTSPTNHRSPAFTSKIIQTKPVSLRFFDGEDNAEPSQVKGAARWFGKFDADSIQNSLPKRRAQDKRVRVAILDTGIDLKNAWISQRAGRIQCWPPGSDSEDKDGHGTHVAHLILRLAPHALLRICKVSKTRLLKDADIKKIADAIAYFSVGNGRVDIINLSFGFPHYKSQLHPILTAIRNARTNGVLIFAAAGNEGGNQGVFWPAALHDGGDVIRINSSNGDGVPSGFNPDAEIGRRICTLGEGVPSCQPDPKNKLQMIRRNGTSFATPISAAIAAIVLAFMDNVDCSDFEDFGDLLPRLRTVVGMERVLCKMCVRPSSSSSAGFSYITPWYFLEIEEKIRVPMILQILSGVPESPPPTSGVD